MFLNTGGKLSTYICLYCERDISNSLRIRCAECSPPVDLCGDCFASGVNIDEHKNYHGYHVVDCIEHPIFSKDWTISEEILLLEGVDKFGAGNWKAVSEYIGTKTTRHCDEHYWEVYLGLYGHILPPKTILNESIESTFSCLSKIGRHNDQLEISDSISQEPVIVDEMQVPVGHFRGEAILRERARGEGGRGKDKLDLRDKLSQLPGADLPGYMPLRQDFDVEHDNDAEVILAEMDMGGDDSPAGIPDHPSERALKLEVIRIYNRKLDEREKRKRFVIEQGLVDFRRQQQLERRRLLEDRELVAKMKPFSRFQEPAAHEAFVQGLLKARRLRHQIELYQSYRALGIRTLEAARLHEVDRRKKEIDSKAKKQRDREGASAVTSSIGTSSSAASANKGSSAAPTRTRPLRSVGRQEGAGSALGDSVALAPGANLLSGRELSICRDCDLLPLHYLAAKEAVVREAYRNGFGAMSSTAVRRVLRVSQGNASKSSQGPTKPSIKSGVVDFFVREISNAASLSTNTKSISPFLSQITERQRQLSLLRLRTKRPRESDASSNAAQRPKGDTKGSRSAVEQEGGQQSLPGDGPSQDLKYVGDTLVVEGAGAV